MRRYKNISGILLLLFLTPFFGIGCGTEEKSSIEDTAIGTFESTQICEPDGYCEADETASSCPSDCGQVNPLKSQEILSSPFGVNIYQAYSYVRQPNHGGYLVDVDENAILPRMTEEVFEPASELGIKNARIECDLSTTEIPDSGGVLDWRYLDQMVEGLLERGVEPQCMLLKHLGRDAQPTVGSPVWEDWANFVRHLVRRYSGKIKTYIINNEPQFQDRVVLSAAQFIELTAATSNLIREQDPNAKLVMAGIDLNESYFRFLLNEGLHQHVDAYAVHHYMRFPEQGAFQFLFSQGVEGFRTIMSLPELGSPVKPLWVPEAGWHSYQPGVDAALVNETTQAKYVLRHLLLNRGEGMERINVFKMRCPAGTGMENVELCGGESKNSRCHTYCLVQHHSDGTKNVKPAFNAMQRVNRLFSDVTSTEKTAMIRNIENYLPYDTSEQVELMENVGFEEKDEADPTKLHWWTFSNVGRNDGNVNRLVEANFLDEEETAKFDELRASIETAQSGRNQETVFAGNHSIKIDSSDGFGYLDDVHSPYVDVQGKRHLVVSGQFKVVDSTQRYLFIQIIFRRETENGVELVWKDVERINGNTPGWVRIQKVQNVPEGYSQVRLLVRWVVLGAQTSLPTGTAYIDDLSLRALTSTDLPDQVYIPRTLEEPSDVYKYSFETSQGVPVHAFWFGIQSTDRFPPIFADIDAEELVDPILIDLMNGEIREITPDQVAISGNIATYLRIPVVDYPMVLTEKAILSQKTGNVNLVPGSTRRSSGGSGGCASTGAANGLFIFLSCFLALRSFVANLKKS